MTVADVDAYFLRFIIHATLAMSWCQIHYFDHEYLQLCISIIL